MYAYCSNVLPCTVLSSFFFVFLLSVRFNRARLHVVVEEVGDVYQRFVKKHLLRFNKGLSLIPPSHSAQV